MAAPPHVTLKNLDESDWYLNKELSGPDIYSALALQGVTWLLRKALQLSNVTLVFNQYKNAEGVDNIDVVQVLTRGVRGNREHRQLDWNWVNHEDYAFGKVRGRTKWLKLADVEFEFLKTGWLPEMDENDVIFGYMEGVDSPWHANVVWGFAEAGGERRYVRRFLLRKGKETRETVVVYDYAGKKSEFPAESE